MKQKFYTEEYLILFTLSGICIKSSSFMLCCSVVWLLKLRLEKLEKAWHCCFKHIGTKFTKKSKKITEKSKKSIHALTAQTEIRKVRKGLALLVDENSFKHSNITLKSKKCHRQIQTNPLSCLTAETEIRKVRKGLALLLDENSFKYIGSHARSRKYGFVTSKFEVVNILASNIKNYMGS